MREFTPLAIVLGIIIGAVFGAANALIGLKTGIVVGASIPAAVISMGILRGILKRGTILENNMVQTIASAGESMAAGMIFTIPALYLFGFEPRLGEMVIWGCIGGLLGVLFMVPLRRVLIVREHNKLPYPEGVACAEVLESGDRGGSGARTVFWGLGVGAFYELFRSLGFWPAKAMVGIPKLSSAASLNASPALLGIGYILGVRIAGYMLGGAVLGWFVIIPMIGVFGVSASEPIFPATDKLISAMSPDDIWSSYLRYIGAGAVIFGGLVSLVKSTPIIATSLLNVGAGVFSRSSRTIDRTDRDLPLPLLALMLAGLGFAMWRFEEVRVGGAGAIAVLVFAFFFVTVSSRLSGLVGNSSNPASGMTIATLLGTALFFTYGLKMTGDDARFACISVGALVCIAICIAGDCAQDLKTGYLVRATPWKQQVGEMIGVLTITIVIALVIQAVHGTYGFEKTAETPNPVLAPQANIMKVLVEGVMGGSLPWVLIISGMAAALVIELLGIPVLPVAVGLYLPLEISATIMAGALIRWGVEKWRRPSAQSEDSGILAASGLVAGQGLVNLAAVAVAVFIGWKWSDPQFHNPLTGQNEQVIAIHLMPYLSELMGLPQRYGYGEFGFNLFPLVPFGVLMLWLIFTAFRKPDAPMTVSASSALPLTEHTVDDEAVVDLVDDGGKAGEAGEGPARDTTLPFTPPPPDQEED